MTTPTREKMIKKIYDTDLYTLPRGEILEKMIYLRKYRNKPIDDQPIECIEYVYNLCNHE